MGLVNLSLSGAPYKNQESLKISTTKTSNQEGLNPLKLDESLQKKDMSIKNSVISQTGFSEDLNLFVTQIINKETNAVELSWPEKASNSYKAISELGNELKTETPPSEISVLT